MRKKVLYGVFIPLIFAYINYHILKVEFNIYEIIMVLIITLVTIWAYGTTDDYLNPIVYFPVLYFLLYWIGDFDLGLGYSPVPKKIWIYYLLGLTGYYLGSLFVQKLKIKPRIYKNKDYLSLNTHHIFYLIYAVCFLCKLVTYLQFGIPILVNNVDATRQAIAEGTGILKVISSAHTILAVFFFYDVISRWKSKKKIPSGGVILIACSFILSILDASRLLIIQMVLPMLFIFVLKIRKVKLKTVLIFSVIVLVFISANKFIRNILENPSYFSYVMNSRNSSVIMNVWMSGFNSFRVGIDDFCKLVEIVPYKSSYTYGMMFMNSILSVLPGKQVVMGYYVADLLGLSFDGMGAATTILGMFYLDGGPALIFIGMLLFGMFIQYNYKRYIQRNNVCIYSLMGIYIIYYSVLCLRTNVMPTIEPLISIFYFWGFSFIARKIRIRLKNGE